MTVNFVTGSMLKGLREGGCRITTICKCKGYVWNLRGHNFCDDHPVLLVFGKSATPMQFFRLIALQKIKQESFS